MPPKSNKPITSPIKAIRAFCLGCLETRTDVEKCDSTDCSLHPFRFGKNPYSKRKGRAMTEEQKAAAKIRMQKMWEEKKGKPNNAKKEEETEDSPFA